MTRRTLVAMGLMLMLTASAVSAQDPDGPAPGGPGAGGPGGGGFGAMGGPGMMFGGGFGFGGMSNNSLTLLGMPAVQKELSMTDDQKTQLTQLQQKSQEQMRTAMPNFQQMQGMSQDEMTKFFADSRKKMEDANKQTEEQIGKLLDAKQLERLKQVQLQIQGVSALLSPDVVAKLKLSTDAQAKMKQIIMDNARNQVPVFGFDQSDEDRKAAAAKMEEQRKATMKAVLAVLDDDQLVQWATMIGDDFQLPQGQGFGFGFGGPGQGGFGPGGFGPGGAPGGFGPGGPGGPGGAPGGAPGNLDDSGQPND